MKTIATILTLAFSTLIAFSQNNSTEWDDYFMPGIGYKLYLPKNHEELGTYKGIMTEFVFYARAKEKNSYRYSGPARVKTYGNLSILTSDNENAKDIFMTTVGVNLSFETSCQRKLSIPYFGLETGGVFQRDFSTLQFTPACGIQLISSKHVLWNIQCGYQYTVKKFDEYSGLTFSSSLNILLWNNENE
jgi:hypothetical protein